MPSTTSSSVKILGGRSVVQIASISSNDKSQLIPAFDPSNIQLRMAKITEPINQWKNVTMTFEAGSKDYVESLLQPFISQFSDQNKYPGVSFRFGLVAGSDTPVWRPWEDMFIARIRTTVRPDVQSGPLVTVNLVDRLWLWNSNSKIRTLKGQVSQVISSIWDENGGTESLIEDTKLVSHSSLTGVWYQGRENDWSFATRSLLPLARNSNGVSGYRLFVRDNFLRFHSPGYGAANPLKLAYTQGQPGFNSLAIEDNSVIGSGESASSGSSQATTDPLTGVSTLENSDSASLVKFASFRPVYSKESYKYSHVGLNTVSTEGARNQQSYEAFNSEMYQLTLSSEKCMDVRLGDVLDVSLSGGESVSQYSGLWLVNRAVHLLIEGGLSSKYVLARGEYNRPSSKVVSDSGTQPSSQPTPGRNFVSDTGASQPASSDAEVSRIVQDPS